MGYTLLIIGGMVLTLTAVGIVFSSRPIYDYKVNDCFYFVVYERNNGEIWRRTAIGANPDNVLNVVSRTVPDLLKVHMITKHDVIAQAKMESFNV